MHKPVKTRASEEKGLTSRMAVGYEEEDTENDYLC